MELRDAVLQRRSVRKFTEEAVSTEDLKKIMELTAYAPSWKNVQPTRYIALFNSEKKRRVAEEAVLGFQMNTDTIKNAPLLIIVTTVDSRSGFERDGSFSTSKGTHWQSMDAGISAQTFCLAAQEYGYGTCIQGIFDEEKVKEIVEIPEGQSVSALIPMGRPSGETPAPKRKEVEALLTIQE